MSDLKKFTCLGAGTCFKWWHSNVISSSLQPWRTGNEVPVPLTSVWTPNKICEDRWKLSRTDTWTSYKFDSTGSITAESPLTYEFVGYSTLARKDALITGSIVTGVDSGINQADSAYESKCLPSAYQSLYSPGVCPDKHTVAEVTAWTSITGNDGAVETHYLASCCRSGMSFDATASGNGVRLRYCLSSISSPVRVLQPCTNSTAIFWQSVLTLTGSRGPYLSVIENATTITQGLLVAEPIRVGWWEKELVLFPTSYASSVAKQAGLKWGAPTPAPASISSLPRETNQAQSPSRKVVSTGEKVGIVVGVVGAVFLGSLLLWLLLRRRRQREPQIAEIEGRPKPEMEDQDQELATRRWFLRGRWRSEVRTQERPGELDSRTVNVVPGPPMEMDATERRNHP